MPILRTPNANLLYGRTATNALANGTRLDGKQLAFPKMCSWRSFKAGKCVEGAKTDKQSFLREFVSKQGHLSFTWSDMKKRLIGKRRAKKLLALFGATAHPPASEPIDPLPPLPPLPRSRS